MMPMHAEELLFEGSLPNKRLRKRAIRVLEAMLERPGAAMTQAFDRRNDRRAAYELIENKQMSLSVVLDPATRAECLRLREQSELSTCLCVQDTTEIRLTHLKAMQGLGPIGNPHDRGLFAHVA